MNALDPEIEALLVAAVQAIEWGWAHPDPDGLEMREQARKAALDMRAYLRAHGVVVDRFGVKGVEK